MKVKVDRLLNLISWVVEYILLSYQVWSWSVKKYSKNKVFISIIIWPNFDLDRWPWPLSFSVMITNPKIHIYDNNDGPSMKNKEVTVFGEN
jgi:hypothetical protein